jgi:hypothetical protein
MAWLAVFAFQQRLGALVADPVSRRGGRSMNHPSVSAKRPDQGSEQHRLELGT